MTRAAGARSLFVLGLAGALCAARVQEPGLAAAAKEADWDLVRALLQESPDTDDVLGDGTTALIWASYWENPEIVELLIAADADVNAASDLGVTALWPAAEHGSLAIAGILLDAGADPDAALLSGETPVMTAARGGHVEVVELLLARGADPNTRATREHTALMWAAAGRHPEVVEALLAGGADVHVRSGSWAQYYQKGGGSSPHPDDEFWLQEGGLTPLLFAARGGDLASARLLVAAGADVNDRTAPCSPRAPRSGRPTRCRLAMRRSWSTSCSRRAPILTRANTGTQRCTRRFSGGARGPCGPSSRTGRIRMRRSGPP